MPAPTSAAATTRGRRAMKKTWASTLSANGIVRLKTRDRWMVVLPTIGASRHAAAVVAPKMARVTASRRRTSLRAGKWHHREMTGAWMSGDVGVDAVERADVRRVQHAIG